MLVSQVCVEPRTSALNMTLPAAAARGLQLSGTWRRQLSIDISTARAPAQQQTCRTSLAAVDRREIQRQTPDRYIDLHRMRVASIFLKNDIVGSTPVFC